MRIEKRQNKQWLLSFFYRNIFEKETSKAVAIKAIANKDIENLGYLSDSFDSISSFVFITNSFASKSVFLSII